MTGCDTLLMVGSSFPYSEFLPEEGDARGVQIDIDARMISIRYPMEVNLVGDSARTLRALIPLLQRKADRSWRDKVEDNVADWWGVLEERAMNDADPINPQRVFWELSSRLPDNAILSSDSGSAANWFARDVKLRRGMKASLSGTLATMGPGVPYAIAAKFAFPDRVAIALVGDGAMQMNGNSELVTVAKYWERWSDPRLIVLVLNNRDLNQVTWEQRAVEGDPKFEAAQQLPDFPYAAYADLIGLRGIRVETPGQVGPAWDAALSADRPVVIEALTDPEVPPLPPHITIEQAKALTSSCSSATRARAGSSARRCATRWRSSSPAAHDRDRRPDGDRSRRAAAGGRRLHHPHRRAGVRRRHSRARTPHPPWPRHHDRGGIPADRADATRRPQRPSWRSPRGWRNGSPAGPSGPGPRLAYGFWNAKG